MCFSLFCTIDFLFKVIYNLGKGSSMKKYSKLRDFYHNNQKSLQGELIFPVDFGKYPLKRDDYENFWVKEKNLKKSLVKEDDEYNSSLGELYYYYLAKAAGLTTVEVLPALTVYSNGKSTNAALIENFIKKASNSEEVFGNVFLHRYAEARDDYKNAITNYVQAQDRALDEHLHTSEINYDGDANLKSKLMLMHMLDILTLNSDRHSGNISLVLTHEENISTYTLAKPFDQSFAFRMHEYNSGKYHNFDHMLFNSLENFYFYLTIHPISKKELPTFSYVKNELAKEMQIDPDLYQKFLKIKEIDIDLITQQIKNDFPDYNITPKQAGFAKDIFELTTRSVEYDFNRLQQESQKQAEKLAKKLARSRQQTR